MAHIFLLTMPQYCYWSLSARRLGPTMLCICVDWLGTRTAHAFCCFGWRAGVGKALFAGGLIAKAGDSWKKVSGKKKKLRGLLLWLGSSLSIRRCVSIYALSCYVYPAKRVLISAILHCTRLYILSELEQGGRRHRGQCIDSDHIVSPSSLLLSPWITTTLLSPPKHPCAILKGGRI